MSKDETACVYASLILADDDIAVTVSFLLVTGDNMSQGFQLEMYRQIL